MTAPDSTPTERDDVAAVLAEAVWDALDAQHDKAFHFHAAECCWSFGGATQAITAALAPLIAAREQAARAEALREAADEVEDECARDSVTCYCSSADWLRERADRIGGEV